MTQPSVDLQPETIEHLFFSQVRDLTLRSMRSFDYQFSDLWC